MDHSVVDSGGMVSSPHLTCLEPKDVWDLCAGEIRRLVCGGEKAGQDSGTVCEPKVPPPVRDVRRAVQVPRVSTTFLQIGKTCILPHRNG